MIACRKVVTADIKKDAVDRINGGKILCCYFVRRKVQNYEALFLNFIRVGAMFPKSMREIRG